MSVGKDLIWHEHIYEDMSMVINDKVNLENFGLSKLNCFKELRGTTTEINGIMQ